jgi:small subunit ribosomal protein S7
MDEGKPETEIKEGASPDPKASQVTEETTSKKETEKQEKDSAPQTIPEEKPKPPKKAPSLVPEKLFLFDKYDISAVVVRDMGLARYMNLDPVSVPHTGAKHANRPFAKNKMNIVERLVNNMMRTENFTGKKTKTYNVVKKAFDIINSKTKNNPVQVFIDALENASTREEVTRLKYGGVSVPKAVDTSSARRLDIAIRNICKGAIAASHKSTKPIEICLANEIMLAAKGDMNSFAVSKREEIERVASSAR